jgi:putative hemolysin
MRARRVPFCIVVDEHGGMAGIVTLEDVVEELVGEIFSEHAQKVTDLYAREADGSITVKGHAPVRELNRDLGLELPEGDWFTIAGLCLSLASRIPATGERLSIPDGPTLEIVEASSRRVRTVRIHPVRR